ncbi:MAG: ATP-binding cassette domain-containing protein [Pseudomonadota bacterium]
MVTDILPLKLQDAVVRKRGKTIIGPVDLEIRKQGLTVIMGPNGSGKTTLLRLMHGLERPRKGTVSWNSETGEAQERQAFVFQTPILLRRSTIDNIAYPLKLQNIPATQAQAIAEEWLVQVGLDNARELNASFLSAGEQQKLALARALACKPEILFLDEPTANLDGRATREIETILKDALFSGVRIVMTTHDTSQGKRLADEVLFMYHGKIHEQGLSEPFFANPITREAKAFLKGDIVE